MHQRGSISKDFESTGFTIRSKHRAFLWYATINNLTRERLH